MSLRWDGSFYIPLLPSPDMRILPCEQIPNSSITVQNPPVLLTPKSDCQLQSALCCRYRSQPLSSVSRKQRYNTLDFPTENRVPTGVLLAPIGNPEPRGVFPPLDTPPVRAVAIHPAPARWIHSCPNRKTDTEIHPYRE